MQAPSSAGSTRGLEGVILMTRREELEAALEGWRTAERRLETQTGDRETTVSEIARHRAEFQRLCAREVVISAAPTARERVKAAR